MDTRSRDGSSGQKIWTRSSRQDRARSKRSTGQIGTFHFGETKNRSAQLRTSSKIGRSQDRTDPKARSTQVYYLLSEDFRTAKTPIPKTNRDRCDSRSRSRHRPRVTAATQDCGKAVSKKSLWDVERRSRKGDRTGPTFRLNQDHCDGMIQAGTGG